MLKQSQDFGDSNSDWEQCPAGALADLSDGLRTRRRNQQRRQTMYGVTLTAVALMIVTGLFLSDDPGSNMPPACQRVSPMLAAYHQNELSPAERAEVEAHLKICPHCREAYNQIRGDQRHSAQLRATVSTAALSRVGAWEFFAYPSR